MDVLVVDDEADGRETVARVLEREGLYVLEAASGTSALDIAGRHRLDLVIIDVNLPDMSGLAVLDALRAIDPVLPVLMLTGAASEADRLAGLRRGADDYLVKPYSVDELTARVLAFRRRARAGRRERLDFGRLRIDLTAREVILDGQPVEMTPRELDLLVHLAKNARTPLSRDQLLRAVWQSSAEWQDDATVTEHIRRLRHKLEHDPNDPKLLVTVRGVGYRFDPPAPNRFPNAPSRAMDALEVIVVVVATTIHYATDQAIELLGGRSPADVVGHDVLEFIAAPSIAAMRARHERARLGRWPPPERIILQTLDGREVPVTMASTAVRWVGQPASQVMMWPQATDEVSSS